MFGTVPNRHSHALWGHVAGETTVDALVANTCSL